VPAQVPVFGVILTGYLAGRCEVLGSDSAALNRLFSFRAPSRTVHLYGAGASGKDIQPAFHRCFYRRWARDTSDCSAGWTVLASAGSGKRAPLPACLPSKPIPFT